MIIYQFGANQLELNDDETLTGSVSGTSYVIPNGDDPLYADHLGDGWSPIAFRGVTNDRIWLLWENTALDSYIFWTLDWDTGVKLDEFTLAGDMIATYESIFGLDFDEDSALGAGAYNLASRDYDGLEHKLSVTASGHLAIKVGTVDYTFLQVDGASVIYDDAEPGHQARTFKRLDDGSYEVLWKFGQNATDETFLIWSVSADGIRTSREVLDGDQNDLLELEFGLDLDGDGGIGPDAVEIDTYGLDWTLQTSAGLVAVVEDGNVMLVQLNGANVAADQFGQAWSVEKLAVQGETIFLLWRNDANGLSAIWELDSNGNYVSSRIIASDQEIAFEALFDEDFNGDPFINDAASSIDLHGNETLSRSEEGHLLIDSVLLPVFYNGQAVKTDQFGEDWAV